MSLRDGQISLVVGVLGLCLCLGLANLLSAVQSSDGGLWIEILTNALQVNCYPTPRSWLGYLYGDLWKFLYLAGITTTD